MFTKKLLFIALVMLVFAAVMPTMWAMAVDEEAETTPFDFSQTIRVGYYSDFTDFIVDIDNLNNKGYGYDIFEKISEVSDLEFEYVPIEDSLATAVNSGYVDIGAFYTRSDERRESVLFSETQYSKTYVALMSKDFGIAYADLEAIDGKTVATYDENIGVENLDKICEYYGISVDYVYGDATDYMDLDTDFYITYSEDPDSNLMNNVLSLGVYNLYAITNFENQELIDKIDAIFLDIVATEGNYFLELEEKYLASNIAINHRGLTLDEIETIRQRPLEVGYVTELAPMSYTNEEGEASGILVDVLNGYAKRFGFEINYHPYSLNDPPESLKDFDMLATLYGNGEAIYDNFVTTEAFYNIPMYAVINRDIIDTAVRQDLMYSSPKMATLPYQTIDFELFQEAFPSAEIIFKNEWHDVLDSLTNGEVGMILCTESATSYTEIYFKDLNTSTIPTDTFAPMQFFINKDIAEEYIPIFNVMADRFAEREYEAIIETNSNDALPSGEPTVWEVVREYWYYFVMGLILVIVAFVFIYYRGQIEKKEALLKSYNTDPLTGLMAIQKFRETIDEKMESASPGEYELISFDIDMFKTINTHFSTERGTAIIVAVGNSLKKAFEKTEAIISRRTADQFLIFRPVNAGGSMRQIYGTDILPSIEENVNEKYKVSLSFGNVIIDNVKTKSTSLMGQADSARNAGKSTHKTTFITFDDKMRKLYEDKVNITFRMEQALKDREFEVEYQPKIDFNTLKVGGAEALVRWRPPQGDTIYPDAFIPVFEENGFISDLDLYVFEEVCKCIKSNCLTIEIPRISVNFSAHTVLSDNIISRTINIIQNYKIDPEMIELELTESAVERDIEKFLTTVKQFKKIGFMISIDDFGAGVSSLNRLSAIEADVLKLDKAFFDLKGQGSKSTVVVTDIISMAKHLDMKVVAEGVETGSQAFWLKNIGCDYAQGYYFARPMKVDDFKDLLISKKQYEISL